MGRLNPLQRFSPMSLLIGKGGNVTIAYATLEQLDDIVRRLSNGPRKAAADDGDTDEVAEEGISGSDIGHPDALN